MENIEKNITLRLRFNKEIDKTSTEILQKCAALKTKVTPNYTLKIVDSHIWLGIGTNKKQKYSPLLHLELEDIAPNKTNVRGLFGPDPVLWTLFMFLHFLVAVVFFLFGVFAYSKHVLKQNITFEIVVMVAMVFAWFSLYFIALHNRQKGIPQMQELEQLMEQVLK